MMGHANIATTMRYLHYVEDPRASATLSALWAVGKGQPGGLICAPFVVVGSAAFGGPWRAVTDRLQVALGRKSSVAGISGEATTGIEPV
jgi:hypothetical protein